MANASQPLADWSKLISSLDLTKGTEDLLRMFSGLKVPGVNMDALVASQRDNLEALGASNRAALEGMKAVAEWQTKILAETMQELTAAIQGLAAKGSPQQMVANETQLAEKAIETAVKRMQELAEIVTNANKQATDAIVKRIPESLDEIRHALKVEQGSKSS